MTRRIGYVLLEPPRYSETFILNEIVALRERGIPARIYCLQGEESVEEIPDPLVPIIEVLSEKDKALEISFHDAMETMESNPDAFADLMKASFAKFELRSREGAEVSTRRAPFWKTACALRIAASCRRDGIEHLHCHYANHPAEVGSMAARLNGISWSFTGHAKDIFTLDPDRLRQRIQEAEFVIGCSRTGVDHMRNAAPGCADRIHCVYHGIRLEEWAVDREPVKGPPFLMAVGRLTPKKGFIDFVRAMGILRDRGIEAQAAIIGEGRERDRLTALIQELGLGDRVRLPGRMPQEGIRRQFRTATALVLPSVVLKSNNQDGLANVVLEAMAVGVPVVVSDIPALLEVVTHRETGLVFPSGDSAALADRLAELLGDPLLQESLSSKGRERISTFDCSRAADQLAHLLNSHA